MKISKIVKREEGNKDIVLHKEGLFCLPREILYISLGGWAYKHSAFLFVNNIKEYNEMHNYFKNIGQDVVYIGFQDSYYDKIVL